MLSLDEGKELVKTARNTVEKCLEGKAFTLEKNDDVVLNQKRGVFVTIEKFPDNSLRGCIGFPQANFPLYEAVQRAAFSSAFEDSRFSPLKKEELSKVVFEVSIMTKPELIQVKEPKEYLNKIEKGKDGLILLNGPFSGLLLPQVWDMVPIKEKFLQSLCFKAGLTQNFWQDKNTRIFRFRVQAFEEIKPYGEVIEVKLEHA